jgi:membrane protein
MQIHWFVRLLRKTVTKWWGDKALRLSAALSYYTLFSLAPFLTIAVAIAGLVVDEKVLQNEVLSQFQGLLGQPGAEAIATMLASASDPKHGTIATVLSMLTLVVVSMGMFSELQDALNLIWRIPGTEGAGVWGEIKSKFLSFILVIVTGFLLMVSLIISAFLAAVGKFVHRQVPAPEIIMTLFDLTVSLIVISLLFALMFKVLPDTYVAWRDVWVGAAVTGMLFTLGKWAIGLYLGTSLMASIYGAASSLMVILVWVYYSAMIFFLGAEFTVVYANEYGSRVTSQKRRLDILKIKRSP